MIQCNLHLSVEPQGARTWQGASRVRPRLYTNLAKKGKKRFLLYVSKFSRILFLIFGIFPNFLFKVFTLLNGQFARGLPSNATTVVLQQLLMISFTNRTFGWSLKWTDVLYLCSPAIFQVQILGTKNGSCAVRASPASQGDWIVSISILHHCGRRHEGQLWDPACLYWFFPSKSNFDPNCDFYCFRRRTPPSSPSWTSSCGTLASASSGSPGFSGSCQGWHCNLLTNRRKSEKLLSLDTQQKNSLPWKNIAAGDYTVQICGISQAEKHKCYLVPGGRGINWRGKLTETATIIWCKKLWHLAWWV